MKLKELIIKKKWKEVDEGYDSVIQELNQLRTNAINYKNESEFFQDSDAYSSNPFKVLKIPVDASIEEIKKLYKELCKVYHPDKANIADDSAIKEINAAYAKIKKIRNFS